MFEQTCDITPDALIGEVESSVRDESRVMARRMAAIAGLLTHRTAEAEGVDPDPGWSMITGFARTSAEVGAAMNMAPSMASRLVAQAEALDLRLPKIAAMLADGAVDWPTVTLIITRTELVSDALIDQVDASLADRLSRWQCWSRKRLINTVDKEVRTVDPEAAKERRASADGQRYLNVTPRPDGTAQVSGRITATAAAAFERRAAHMMKSLCANDSRTVDQRRSDVFTALTERRDRLVCDCGRPDCPARPTENSDGVAEDSAMRTVVNVIATEATLTGDSEEPGYLEGFGVVDADVVREMAADNAAVRLVEQPTVTDVEARRYQPGAALARWIRCRDMTCRFPGCDRPVAACDIDHTTPFNHSDPSAGGLTVPWGLADYCRQHHRLKTFLSGPDGWQDEQLDDGTIVWTSPTGRKYRTTPDGPELFPQMRPACAEPSPRNRNRAREKATRIARIREQLRAQRPVNEAQRRLDRARLREIDLRKWRNNSRKLMFILKGGQPSTSPFARWINDPLEPEELEPGWRPPPEPPAPDSDDPPF